MVKALEDENGEVLRRSVHKQAIATEMLEQFAQKREAPPYALAADERTAVREALARAKCGEFASEADVDAILWRPWG
jgi:hypothetical protein